MPVFVTLHLHTDGPIPGPHSLLTLSSAAYDGSLLGTFSANVQELPGATLHPAALAHWRTRAADWLATRRAARPPALVADAYLRWVRHLPGPPTLATDPLGPDYLFLYWYLQRFTGEWPFARTAAEPHLPRPPCALTGCRNPLAATS